MKSTIFIERLSLDMSIGIYPEEKQAKQRVLVSVWLDVDLSAEAYTAENIDQTLSYEQVVYDISDLAQRQHYELVETFAHEIMELSKTYPQVTHIKVKIAKPDIFPQCESVGVVLEASC